MNPEDRWRSMTPAQFLLLAQKTLAQWPNDATVLVKSGNRTGNLCVLVDGEYVGVVDLGFNELCVFGDE